MYHHQQLDFPPPPSQSRRPWSPHRPESYSRYPSQAPRREHSDTDGSLEVLDLADYASMLPHYRDNAHNTYSSQHKSHYPDYPSTPPRSFSLASRSSFPMSAPSLVSGVSSTSHSRSPRLQTPPPLHRPFSLLPHSSPDSTPRLSHNYPWLVEPQPITDQDEEADISTFPEWSRNWYRSQKSTKTMINSYAPIPSDPAQLSSSFDSFDGYHPAQPYSSTSDSHRNLLPWTPDDDGTGVRISPEMKEERMRMLEREFGRNSSKQNTWNHGSKVIGSVNAKGNIITPGPKKRIIVRWMQGVFALGAAVASLYSALILKPVGSPPPRGTTPAYLLYILSVITVLLLLYVIVFRPCCCPGKRGRKASPGEPNGMMVLPVQGLPGADKKKKGKRKKKDEGAGNISVNLIVDPAMFSSLGRCDKEKDEEVEEAVSSSGPHGRRRRGLFEGLAMEEQWNVARRELKRLAFFDCALLSLWFAELIVIILGKRCPVGKFEGWCDGYNVATALVAFLSVSFGFSVFFDIKDLHLSKVSPRTRT